MFDRALKFYSSMLAATAAPRNEKGQGTLEYVGIVIIAAILVLAVVGAIKGAKIDDVITKQIAKITGAGG
ncbi:hypothetical protein [Aeromicrobium sp.]|uniref:hypothetical protein n=1 Tax=Aeromicrobium sp. TaxID=1871063 RepID=UPI003D6A9F32